MTRRGSATGKSSSNETMCADAGSIRVRQQSIIRSVLSIGKTVQKLQKHRSSEQLLALLTDCGLSDREIAAYLSFPSTLLEFEKQLTRSGLGYDGVAELLPLGREAASHAISLLASTGRLGQVEIGQLRQVPDAKSVSDHEALLEQRSIRMSLEARRLADAHVEQFTANARKLYTLMKQLRAKYVELAYYFQRIEHEYEENLIDDDEVQRRHSAWSDVDVRGTEFMVETRLQISALAVSLLEDFDRLLPFANVSRIDWLNPGIDDETRNLSESRYALAKLAEGSFSADFPSDTSRFYTWEPIEAIAYLAGIPSDVGSSRRFAPRPVKKLNAVSISTVSGAELIGLTNAGFRIRGFYFKRAPNKTPAMNRRDWPQGANSIEGGDFSTDLLTKCSVLGNQELHLITGVIPGEPFRESGHGEHDKREKFALALRAITVSKPQGFFFECEHEFDEPKHTPFKTKLMAQAREQGYISVGVARLDAQHFGIPQERKRVIFLGVRSDCASSLRIPCLAKPLHRTVGQCIVDIAFPYAAEIRSLPKKRRSPSQINYLNWEQEWLSTYGKSLAVPDTLTLVRKARGYEDKWLEAGFVIGDDAILQPGPHLSIYSRLPLTIDILKRLQGVPPDWEFEGSYDEQVEQICQTPPAVITRLMGHSVHEALTGNIVDFDEAAAANIHTKRWKASKGFHSMADADDPAMRIRADWREYVREAEGSEAEAHITSW